MCERFEHRRTIKIKDAKRPSEEIYNGKHWHIKEFQFEHRKQFIKHSHNYVDMLYWRLTGRQKHDKVPVGRKVLSIRWQKTLWWNKFAKISLPFPLSAFVLLQHLFLHLLKKRHVVCCLRGYPACLYHTYLIRCLRCFDSWSKYDFISLWACSSDFVLPASVQKNSSPWGGNSILDHIDETRLAVCSEAASDQTYGTGGSWQIGILIIQTFHRGRAALWKEKQPHRCN